MKQHSRARTAPAWHAHPVQQRVLFFTTQARPGWSAAHRGSYVLCFPSWYRLDRQGVLHRVGLTAILSAQKATTTVASWREDLEGLVCRPLESDMQAFRAQLPFTVITPCPRVEYGPMYVFPAEEYVLVGHHLYRTDRRGYLCPLGECSARNCKTMNDFQRCVRQLTSITEEVQIHARPKRVGQAAGTHRSLRTPPTIMRSGHQQTTSVLRKEVSYGTQSHASHQSL